MKMEGNALLIGSVIGIPIRLHISLLLVVGYFAIKSGVGFFIILLLSLGIFGSVALHELGHSIVARLFGSYIHDIMLYPFGGVTRISNMPKRPESEMLVALAGPAVSLFLALLFGLLGFHLLASLNLMLFGFNLLPAFPMDGGRVFRAILAKKKGRLEATRIAANWGKYICIIFVLYGIFSPRNGIFSPRNIALTFIGIFLYFAGRAEYRMIQKEYKADPFGTTGDLPGIEVSPPPYKKSFEKKWKDLFHF